jgi:hypothetical protein
MKDFHFKFHLGKKEKTVRQWAVYALLSSLAASLLSLLLSSGLGRYVTKLSCEFAYELSNEDISRLLATLCKSGKDGEVTEDEARAIIDRASKAARVEPVTTYLDEDPKNLERRGEEEVDFAVESWRRKNPGPKIDPALRRQFPDFSEEQLCVLSQAERYADGNAIGIRYAGMGVCEEE